MMTILLWSYQWQKTHLDFYSFKVRFCFFKMQFENNINIVTFRESITKINFVNVKRISMCCLLSAFVHFIGMKCSCIAHRLEKSFYTRAILYKSCADCMNNIKPIVFFLLLFLNYLELNISKYSMMTVNQENRELLSI